MKRNFKNTIQFATRFIASNWKDKELKRERKWLLSRATQVSQDTNNRFAFQVPAHISSHRSSTMENSRCSYLSRLSG